MMNKILIPLLLLITQTAFAQSKTEENNPRGGVLYSRVGYDSNHIKHIILRGANKEYIEENAVFTILAKNGKEVFRGKIKFWGNKWQNFWWLVDFTDLKTEGEFTCRIETGNDHLETGAFKVRSNLLWEDTWKIVTLDQLKARIEFRDKNVVKHGPEHAQGGGWQDCGGYLREVNSHATMIVGLLDLLEFSAHKIQTSDQQKIVEQILVGLDYIAFCQDKARELGKGEGAIIHEWPKHRNVITGDVAKGALCFTRAGHLLRKYNKDKAVEYLQRGLRSFKWLDANGAIHHPGGTDFHGRVQPDDGYSRIAHGAPKGYKRPEEWKTRDIVMMMWTAVELTKSGEEEYKEYAVRYANMLAGRQISKDEPEGKYYGHFKAYASSDHSEKAWEHHHMGYDAGATFPHYIVPLFEMIRLWPKHEYVNTWRTIIKDFAYGYFLPACFDNPFYLLPMGYFKNEGLLTFSGLWHGMNGAYGSAAALALEMGKFTGDKRFNQIATGNLQWIAGLNAGIAENGKFVSKSMIYGIGDEFIGSWTKIPGTICNGFESDRQFYYAEPKASNDGPWVFTDEGWITHSGGWISAISRLEN
ncbi:glycoside hydrolase family 9 protein [Fulvivirgaceae bacterium BMA10]|uniref:Glycoside hydrolase family 9 protein n=1 Tax=Splendidivirga corallicola TaxID=3051826 RepID=A0ABT8KTU7_9BACT|nr:glycoside hydrolase family 9 protein [Fulvivirgaceae bacterium BMA10]